MLAFANIPVMHTMPEAWHSGASSSQAALRLRNPESLWPMARTPNAFYPITSHLPRYESEPGCWSQGRLPAPILQWLPFGSRSLLTAPLACGKGLATNRRVDGVEGAQSMDVGNAADGDRIAQILNLALRISELRPRGKTRAVWIARSREVIPVAGHLFSQLPIGRSPVPRRLIQVVEDVPELGEVESESRLPAAIKPERLGALGHHYRRRRPSIRAVGRPKGGANPASGFRSRLWLVGSAIV